MVKELLKSSGVLVHLHERLPLVLSCDASPYGVGVVLAHWMPDGLEHPIRFVSRSLSFCREEVFSVRQGSSCNNFWSYRGSINNSLGESSN